MRVALDATPLTLTSGGLRRYTEQLSLSLSAAFPDDLYVLMSDQTFTVPEPHPANLRRASPPQNWLQRKWWLAGASIATRRSHLQIFHGTNFEVPYLNLAPSVLTLHDLSPWKDAAWHQTADRVKQRTPWLLRLGIATMVITPSKAIRSGAIEYLGIAPERIVAIPHGPAHLSGVKDPALERPPFFLFAGTLEPRKNLETLVAAWREVRREHTVDLVLAGRRRPDGPSFEPEPGLRVLGEVTDAQLADLYGSATALVYPSHYEGFGLPVLEAMQAGAPVIISHDPALLEVAEEAGLRAGSARELAGAMRTLVENEQVAAEYRARSRRRAQQFTWKETARQTRAVYGEAIARFG